MEVAAGRPGGGPLRRFFPPGSTTTVILFGVALALACACVVGGVLSFRSHQDRQDEKAEQERYGDVIAAATKEAEAFINIDYRDPDATFDAVATGATGEFKTQYKSVSKDLIELLTTATSVMNGEVVNAAVSNIDNDSARVLIATEGTVANIGVKNSKKQARSFRLALELVRSDGKWLTNNLEFVG
jgi:Mce-associated membrane protein